MAFDITGLGSLLDFTGKIVDRVWPDPTKAAEIKGELLKAEQAGALQEMTNAWDNAKAQSAVNQTEAGSNSLFVSGWRPFVGWVCGVAFGYKFILAPFLIFIMYSSGHPVILPALDYTEMLPILFGMLGLGAMRSYEKTRGVPVKG